MTNLTETSQPDCVDVPSEEENPSYYTADYTYSYDKYSCVRTFYFVHIAFNYVIFVSGILAMLTRILPPRFKAYHSWCGRTYILSMLWSTCASLLMNNTGLPLATLISFATCMVGLTVGWIIIILYKANVEAAARKVVQRRLKERILASRGKKVAEEEVGAESDDVDLAAMTNEARTEILEARTWYQRYFSLKALHGILFFASWFQIAGRIFATPVSGEYWCETYPVYKPVVSKENVDGTAHFVPFEDPNYDEKPWSNGMTIWFLQTTVGSIGIAAVVGLVVSVWCAKRAEKRISGEDPLVSMGDTAHANSSDGNNSSSHNDNFEDDEEVADTSTKS
eukprot:CAMPEP_0197433386 /NCGR_PEP_ID=MMETSP1175-20131217/1277_1 /TAXON_ID=1003142 /ORGANISM="Triceratium dubium, Strain CCMP147" /LENGTH=336 /DNA_ID=CAMNT_0042961745 /DNA_START=229 /DNA_END=1239 /DNA_ORIENTATION=+